MCGTDLLATACVRPTPGSTGERAPVRGAYRPNQTGYHDGYLSALDATSAEHLSASRHQTELTRALTATGVADMNRGCTPRAGLLVRMEFAQPGIC